jgi:hypothetical protein
MPVTTHAFKCGECRRCWIIHEVSIVRDKPSCPDCGELGHSIELASALADQPKSGPPKKRAGTAR